MATYSIALILIVLAVAGSSAGIHAALTSPNTKFQVVEGSDLADLGLRKVPQVTADKHGAKCIDGSVPAYYISKLNTSSTQWVVYFKGGGWCFDEEDCLERSTSTLGSSTHLPGTFNWEYGVTQGDPAHNPHFHTFNRVVLWYCDGGSWTGARTDPVMVNGTALWFRGRANIDAQFDDLSTQFGFNKATEVLLGGGSAGALASYLHANYVADNWIPASVTRLKLLPASGFFLNATNTQGTYVYGDALRYTARMMNSSSGLNQGCVKAAMESSGEWERCITARYTVPAIKMPTFVLNSIHDYWQVMCVLTATPANEGTSETCSATPGWHDCAVAGNFHLSTCSSSQVNRLNAYGQEFMAQWTASGAPSRPGWGAFLSSCVTHVSTFSPLFVRLTIDGTTMSDAIAAWWAADATAPPSANIHMACDLKPDTGNHQCNPTCV